MSNREKAWHETHISNIQSSIEHYHSRLRANHVERDELEQVLAEKEAELKIANAGLEALRSKNAIRVMSSEEQDAFNARIAEHAARRQHEQKD